MRILTLIGARPQFIKAGMVSKAFGKYPSLSEVIVHTGQHYDENMSAVFFEQLAIPKPDYQLDIHGGTHGQMTGRMLMEIENVILAEKPDRVLVYGDTNSTLAGALAASKVNVPVAHVEAGLRSFNMRMPEEINRILTDQLSDILFCPTKAAVCNLEKEGFNGKPVQILDVGDVMQDSAKYFTPFGIPPAGVSEKQCFVLATVHRAENTDDPLRLAGIVEALNEIHRNVCPVLLPLHPRTRAALERMGLKLHGQIVEPVGYLQMVWLLKNCSMVMTDSGGLQKEAFFFGKPCVTLRDQTEWVELLACGANVLAGAQRDQIVSCVRQSMGRVVEDDQQLYGGGQAALKIAEYLAMV
ncbi:non-hydrolyzing UDP-N-acetylglucosamine 2-epimerase [Pseudomonas guariconensis]|uniref:non-hydrolyzing UDP-N-acetylglucosamine 2-epimerase n=1 Tax=Pseudomonas guariconensis TaxID=1288410 RepID=UPI0018AB5A16|nr:UDP-N-acetylglucosamine 2-epimerase (non-hydrolyzing) [Pseudomonas guariconensis]MBF8756134.1 UDP-N-acetylglucosamine 2-epimerase (non-hydrolyzing) [Pseudomonas guariconensis]